MSPRARRAGAVVLLAALACTAFVARLSLERRGEDHVPAGLLYLPKGPYLRALAVGHEETLADLLYIWAIQYYSNYSDKSRYDYLDTVFRGAITELDPRFSEAYLVGALIMSVEARRPALAMRLLDKGIAALPDDWQLAYWAGWEAYTAKDYARARSYWMRATSVKGAPPQLARLAARMLEKQGDEDAAIAEYERLAAAGDEATRAIARSWLARLQTERALGATRRALEVHRARNGRCPTTLEELVREKLLTAVPAGPNGEAFHYDAARCEILPPPGLSFGGS